MPDADYLARLGRVCTWSVLSRKHIGSSSGFHGGAEAKGVGVVAAMSFVNISRNMPMAVVLSTLTMPADIVLARKSSLPPRVVCVTVWHDGGCPLCAREPWPNLEAEMPTR